MRCEYNRKETGEGKVQDGTEEESLKVRKGISLLICGWEGVCVSSVFKFAYENTALGMCLQHVC